MIDDKINLKRILMALRWEILNEGILLTPDRRFLRNECFLPQISSRVKIFYKDDNVCLKTYNKTYEIPVSFEDGKIAENIIDIIVAILQHKGADSKIKY